MMRSLLFASVAAIGLAASAPAFAQGLCTTSQGPCASLPTQLLQYAREADQLVQETATQINTLDTFVTEVKNTVDLPATVFRSLEADIAQIESIRSTANMLTGLSGQIITAINTPGGYPAGSLANWQQIMTNETNAIGLAMKASAAILALQPGQLVQDANILAALNTQGMTADGRQKTLQTLGGTTASAAQSIQKLQSATTSNQQALMTYFAAQEDREYLSRTVSDHDLEVDWVNNCTAIVQLGGTAPPICAGAQ